MSILDKRIIKRAARALKNAPFNIVFYQTIKENGLNAEDVLNKKNQYFKREYLSINQSNSIENEFLWLIKIGVLRREVDGQGLTSKVRITPLGRKILEKKPYLANTTTNFLEKLFICLTHQLMNQ